MAGKACLELDPGLCPVVSDSGDQRLGRLVLPLPAGELPAVAFSELVAGVLSLV